jgi:site-specific DNA recombinase
MHLPCFSFPLFVVSLSPGVSHAAGSFSCRSRAVKPPSQLQRNPGRQPVGIGPRRPVFSSKNGVRYRFYVSSALLRGRKEAAGSVSRIVATEIESAVLDTLEANGNGRKSDNGFIAIETLERVVVGRHQLLIKIAADADPDGATLDIGIARSTETRGTSTVLEGNSRSEGARNKSLIQTIVRAHIWVHCLRDGVYESIEQLAEAKRLHPKVVRQNLRLAFLSPDVTSSILEGQQPAGLMLAHIPKLLPLPWAQHRRLLG